MPVSMFTRIRLAGAALVLAALALAACAPAPPPIAITYQGAPARVRSCPPLLARYVADGNYTVDASLINEMWKSQFPYPSGKEFEAVAASALEQAGCRTAKTAIPMSGPDDVSGLAREAREKGARYVLVASTKLPKMRIVDHDDDGWARYTVPMYDTFALDRQTIYLDYDDAFALYDAMTEKKIFSQSYARQAKTTFEVAYEDSNYNLVLVRNINRLFVETQSAIVREWLQDMDKALNGRPPATD